MNQIDIKSTKIETKFIKVNLNLLSLEKDVEEKELILDREFEINEDVMGDTKIKITNIVAEKVTFLSSKKEDL